MSGYTIDLGGRVAVVTGGGSGIGEATAKLLAQAGAAVAVVNGVSPGTTNTPGASAFIDSVGGEEKLAKAYPLGRLGRPDDIAGAVLFFASPLSDWVTGQILSVSGGYTMV